MATFVILVSRLKWLYTDIYIDFVQKGNVFASIVIILNNGSPHIY